MTVERWMLFAAMETVLCLTPGPAVLLVLSLSLRRGWGFGMRAIGGILVANLLYFAVSATGLGAILLASWNLFFLIKWLGAAYLIWLGLQTFFAKPEEATAPAAPQSSMRTFVHGLVTQGANPKSLLYFTALLPQFVEPSAPLAAQIALLAATSALIELVVLGGYALLASRASRVARTPRFATAFHRASGGLLIGAGAGLALLRRD